MLHGCFTFPEAKLTVRALRRLGVDRRVRRRLELPHPQRPRRRPRHAPEVHKAWCECLKIYEDYNEHSFVPTLVWSALFSPGVERVCRVFLRRHEEAGVASHQRPLSHGPVRRFRGRVGDGQGGAQVHLTGIIDGSPCEIGLRCQ